MKNVSLSPLEKNLRRQCELLLRLTTAQAVFIELELPSTIRIKKLKTFKRKNAKKTNVSALSKENTQISRKLVTKLGEIMGSISVSVKKKDYRPEFKKSFQIFETNCLETILSYREMQKLIGERSQFIANIFHELRTPLNGIIATLELVDLNSLSPQNNKLIEIIDASAKHLYEIVNDLLDYSKLDTTKIELESTDFKISEVIDELRKIFYPISFKKNINLEFSCQILNEPSLKGDPLRIKQVIANLISNAIKFTEQGYVSVKVELVKSENDNWSLRCTVKDTGIGISLEHQDRLFRPFTQADSSTTRKYGGTGLGLSISKKFIQMMKGKLEFKSLEGVGSEFWIDLNLKTGRELQSKPVENTKYLPLSFSVKALIVEDNAINQIVAKEILGSFGCQIEICQNGLEAVNKLKTTSFDIIFMDMMMPVMDGLQAAKIIRQELKINTPIVALTANSDSESKEKCKQAGMDDFVSKPFHRQQLYEKIKNLVKCDLANTAISASNVIDLKIFAKDISRLKKEIISNLKDLSDYDLKNKMHQIKTNLKYLKEPELAQLAEALEHSPNSEEILKFFDIIDLKGIAA